MNNKTIQFLESHQSSLMNFINSDQNSKLALPFFTDEKEKEIYLQAIQEDNDEVRQLELFNFYLQEKMMELFNISFNENEGKYIYRLKPGFKTWLDENVEKLPERIFDYLNASLLQETETTSAFQHIKSSPIDINESHYNYQKRQHIKKYSEIAAIAENAKLNFNQPLTDNTRPKIKALNTIHKVAEGFSAHLSHDRHRNSRLSVRNSILKSYNERLLDVVNQQKSILNQHRDNGIFAKAWRAIKKILTGKEVQPKSSQTINHLSSFFKTSTAGQAPSAKKKKTEKSKKNTPFTRQII